MEEILKIASENNYKIFLAVSDGGLSSYENTREAILKEHPNLEIGRVNLDKNTTNYKIQTTNLLVSESCSADIWRLAFLELLRLVSELPLLLALQRQRGRGVDRFAKRTRPFHRLVDGGAQRPAVPRGEGLPRHRRAFLRRQSGHGSHGDEKADASEMGAGNCFVRLFRVAVVPAARRDCASGTSPFCIFRPLPGPAAAPWLSSPAS